MDLKRSTTCIIYVKVLTRVVELNNIYSSKTWLLNNIISFKADILLSIAFFLYGVFMLRHHSLFVVVLLLLFICKLFKVHVLKLFYNKINFPYLKILIIFAIIGFYILINFFLSRSHRL